MKINKENALKLWKKHYGNKIQVQDFHGNLMHRDTYGDRDSYMLIDGKKVYCGWNIHHIQPQALGGTDSEENLMCVNIITNDAAENKTTFWIDDVLYQVQKIKYTNKHEIVKLQK